MAAPAFAVTATMGNDIVERPHTDSWWHFTMVDVTNPAPFDGYIEQIDYHAAKAGTMRFVVVDPSFAVTWVSELVTVDAPGVGSLQLSGPVGVTTGSNLGVYSTDVAILSHEVSVGGHSVFNVYDSGTPAVGDVISGYVSSYLRTYSLEADVHASTPQICKDGGWEGYGYRNQGQCIASVVANSASGH
jgi:hypothetical protein